MDFGEASFFDVTKFYMRSQSWNFHIGDTWRATPKLSINFGLRWDVATPSLEKWDHLAFFDPFGTESGRRQPAWPHGLGRNQVSIAGHSLWRSGLRRTAPGKDMVQRFFSASGYRLHIERQDRRPRRLWNLLSRLLLPGLERRRGAGRVFDYPRLLRFARRNGACLFAP